MKWITCARPKTDRIACPWLISKFIDPGGEILYVPADQVLQLAAGLDAISFDTPGARYTERDGKCTFEVLMEDYQLENDPALTRLARIVHAADLYGDLGTDPAGPGLLAIGVGGLDVEYDDDILRERGGFVYDALYAWCQREVADTPSPARSATTTCEPPPLQTRVVVAAQDRAHPGRPCSSPVVVADD